MNALVAESCLLFIVLLNPLIVSCSKQGQSRVDTQMANRSDRCCLWNAGQSDTDKDLSLVREDLGRTEEVLDIVDRMNN